MADDPGQPALSQYFGEPEAEENDIFNTGSVQLSQVQLTQTPFSSSKNNLPLPNPATFFDNIATETLNDLQSFDAPSEPLISVPIDKLSISESKPNIAEADRRRDSWIPSKEAKKILSQAPSPGSLSPENNLTMPGVALEADLSDELQSIVAHHLGEEEATQRRVWGNLNVTQDEQGLRELIQDGYFRAAINLTTKLLSKFGQGVKRIGCPSRHSPRSLQLWFTRFALLVKIQNYTVCEREAEAFADLQNPDMYYQFYPDIYPNRSGSMASFSFRLLLAELPMHLNKPKMAIAKLHMMLSVVRQMIKNLELNRCEEGTDKEITQQDRQESLKLWSGREARIQFSVVNCALQMKDYLLAMQIIEDMVASPHWGKPHKRALNSALGRICLQAGHIVGAKNYFAKATEIRVKLGSNEDIRELVDRSLLAISQNCFDEAFTCLTMASQLEPANIMVLNNMAVCKLYSGKLKEAIAIMEKAVKTNPNRGLNESLLLNLCTLYELESSNTMHKKLALLQQLSKYKRDNLTDVTACLKLNV